MQYRWGDYSLDRERNLLMRQGQQIDVSRKILDCIHHLIKQRHRVVDYDELMFKVWGHGNVTSHQLTQIVVATRRAAPWATMAVRRR
jgi:DNA-binding winged helix-turn-helix (wHTH) protein